MSARWPTPRPPRPVRRAPARSGRAPRGRASVGRGEIAIALIIGDLQEPRPRLRKGRPEAPGEQIRFGAPAGRQGEQRELGDAFQVQLRIPKAERTAPRRPGGEPALDAEVGHGRSMSSMGCEVVLVARSVVSSPASGTLRPLGAGRGRPGRPPDRANDAIGVRPPSPGRRGRRPPAAVGSAAGLPVHGIPSRTSRCPLAYGSMSG